MLHLPVVPDISLEEVGIVLHGTREGQSDNSPQMVQATYWLV